MPVKLKVYTNEDDSLLFWSIPEPIPGCRGFAVERTKTPPGGKPITGFLLNRTGFDNENPPQPAGDGAGPTKPSNEWPFQRFSWTDHDANTGDKVSYRVIPVLRADNGNLELLEAQASPPSPPVVLGATGNSRFHPFFNRGFVISQFMARFLKENNLTLKEFKQRISDETDRTIRQFLSGDLRKALLQILDATAESGGQIFAVLFELSDNELIDRLCALGPRAHLVLSNGSITKKKDETTEEARARDENADAREGKVVGDCASASRPLQDTTASV